MTDLQNSPKTALATREVMLRYIPSLAFTHEDTRFQVWREYKPRENWVEITVYYREPESPKYRIDALLIANPLGEDYDYDYRDIRIQRWNTVDEHKKIWGV